ncbi:MAG: hypothetical protein WEA58_07825 [Balneolaceae bacterium]
MIDKLKVKEFIDDQHPVETISEDLPLSKAKSLMILNDYSQLAVTTNNNHLKAISWKSIGKSELINGKIENVKDCLEEPAIIRENDTFIKYLKLIAKKDYVFVNNDKDKLSGIITTYDMTMRFDEFLKPYMQIGIIEEALRQIIKKFTNSQKVSIKSPGKKEKEQLKKITDLTFFEYLNLIGSENNWRGLGFNELDRSSFISHMHEIRGIRNKIAHYSPNPITESEKYRLKVTSDLLLEICSIK